MEDVVGVLDTTGCQVGVKGSKIIDDVGSGKIVSSSFLKTNFTSKKVASFHQIFQASRLCTNGIKTMLHGCTEIWI